jgi:hypothetical protein
VTAGEWVFRHAGGCLIETPDLDVAASGRGGPPWRWVATLWRDRYQPDGWAVLEWEVAERGWWLPLTMAIGDVIEFGITLADEPRGVAGPTVRWYGWVDHATDRALVLHGPYPHPADAAEAAQTLVDELRLDQLDAPEFAGAEPPGA